VNVTANLAGMPSECGNLTIVVARPDAGTVIAGIALHGLFATEDGGKTWSPLGAGAGSAKIINRPTSLLFDPAHPGTFWEAGIYNGGGVYRTTDGGVTFTQLGTIGHNDAVSVDLSDPDRKTLLAGGHEMKRHLMLSTNGGQSWSDIGMNLPADSHFASVPLVLDARTFLLSSCGWGDGTCGIYRSADAGGTWTRATDLPPGPNWVQTPDGAIYFTIYGDAGVMKSTDRGVSWTKVASGMSSNALIELPDHRVVGATANRMMITSDAGKTWAPFGAAAPYAVHMLTYSAMLKAFFIRKADCGNAVLPDAVMKLPLTSTF
jgi:photosystem II stability/assembly factor-like uncharacterized protein